MGRDPQPLPSGRQQLELGVQEFGGNKGGGEDREAWWKGASGSGRGWWGGVGGWVGRSPLWLYTAAPHQPCS